MSQVWEVGQAVARETYNGDLLGKYTIVEVNARSVTTQDGVRWKATGWGYYGDKDPYGPKIVPWTKAHSEQWELLKLRNEVQSAVKLLVQNLEFLTASQIRILLPSLKAVLAGVEAEKTKA
jgi:hypothetical protein